MPKGAVQIPSRLAERVADGLSRELNHFRLPTALPPFQRESNATWIRTRMASSIRH